MDWSSNTYREYADECLRCAKTARNDREQRRLLQMAEAFLRAAVFSERRRIRAATGSDSLAVHSSTMHSRSGRRRRRS
jgi:hypothetical protein